jgi:hypothetical protein
MNQLIIWAQLDKILICQVCTTKWKLKTTLKTIFVVMVHYYVLLILRFLAEWSFSQLWTNNYEELDMKLPS